MKEKEKMHLKLTGEESGRINIKTIKTSWINRDRVETVLVHLDHQSSQIRTKKLFLYFKNKSPLKQKRELKHFPIFWRLCKRAKPDGSFRYLKLDDFNLINKEQMISDGITPYEWAGFEGYCVKDYGVQNVHAKNILSRVDVSKSIVLMFMIDLNMFNTALVQKTEQSKENNLFKNLKITKSIIESHDYKYTENLVIFYNKKSFAEKLSKNNFSQCYSKYNGLNTYTECTNFLIDEVTDWFKKGKKRYDVTVIFQENKELCVNNISNIMEFSRDTCKRNIYREYNMI